MPKDLSGDRLGGGCRAPTLNGTHALLTRYRVEDTKFCESVDDSSTNPPKWYMSTEEHSRILKLLEDSLGIVNKIQKVLGESKMSLLGRFCPCCQ